VEEMEEIVRHNLRTVQACLLKEELWEYQSPW